MGKWKPVIRRKQKMKNSKKNKKTKKFYKKTKKSELEEKYPIEDEEILNLDKQIQKNYFMFEMESNELYEQNILPFKEDLLEDNAKEIDDKLYENIVLNDL